MSLAPSPTSVLSSPNVSQQALSQPSPGTATGTAGALAAVTRECRLLSGPVALSAQLVLLVVVLTALTVKRHRERPRRPLNVWLLDIGKQACSSGAGHTVGLAIAIFAHSKSGQASECGWYLVVYFLDGSLGLTLAITFHKLTTGMARWKQTRSLATKDPTEEHPWWEALVDIGHYGDPAAPSMRKWAIQVVAWVLCVVSARSIVGFVVLTLIPVFATVTGYMDKRFAARPDVYLYLVMVCIPLVINVGQAWIQDQVLKWKHRPKQSDEKRDHDLDPEESEARHTMTPMDGSLVMQLLVTSQASQSRNR